MVVIAIIAILAAILFPVFARARENARRASCQSNKKQIVLGWLQYTQDYDEKYPLQFASIPPGGGGNNALWNQLIQPYVKSTQVFQCPSDSGNGGVSGWAKADPTGNGYVRPFHTSYIANIQLFNFAGLSMAAVDRPASVIAMTDGGLTGMTTAPFIQPAMPKKSSWILQDPTTNNNSTCCYDLVSTTNGDWAAPSLRHLDTTVVGFVDGHVKSMKIEKFYYGNTPWLDYTKGGT